MGPDLTTSVDNALMASRNDAMASLRHKMNSPEGTRKAAEEFEAMFLSQMFGHMFQGIEPDPLFGGGHGEKMFQSLLVDQYAKSVMNRGGVGLADSIQRSMLSLQEA